MCTMAYPKFIVSNQNGQSGVYYNKPEGRIYCYTKGYLYNELNTYFEIMIGEEKQTIYVSLEKNVITI